MAGLLGLGGWGLLERAEAAYQTDADAKRVNDVHQIAELLEAYRNKVGHLPLMDTMGPNKTTALTVVITSAAEQGEQMSRGNPLAQEVPTLGASDLLAVLRPTLGAALELPIDPQRKPNGAPNAYYVRFKPGDRYLIASFLRHPAPFTTRVAPTVFSYTLRSTADGEDMGVGWDQARSVAEVPPAERATIAAAGRAADARFGRYMRISTGPRAEK